MSTKSILGKSQLIKSTFKGPLSSIPGPENRAGNLIFPASFHPEMVFFANLGVNLRGCLCGVLQYASAQ
ncbi:MAG: hypothetical protein ACQET7_15860, partial [Thermodesulfobacteriota bacterium]